HALVGLVHAEQHNSAEHHHGTRTNCYFMPRLHSIPLRTSTLPSYSQTSAAHLFQYIPRSINPAGTQMSVQLPLPYIRPFGSKCFAGGLLHFRVWASRQGTYCNRYLRRRQPHPLWTCSQPQRPLFYVQNTRKERIPVPPGRDPRCQPTHPL